MHHHHIAVAIVGLLMTASAVFAEDQVIAQAIEHALSSATSSLAENPNSDTTERESRRFIGPRRPWPLPALYGSSAFLQSYDAYLTLAALKRGAAEVNPVLKPISDDPVVFIAVKAGLTATSIFGAERLWKDNHRVSAVVLMAASNAMMVAIAAHNNAVLQRIK